MITPEQFHRNYYGYNEDYDGVAGKQCADLAKKHFEIAGYPYPRDPIGGDGYADNIWYYKDRYKDYYVFIQPSQGFKDGDMVIFPHSKRGGWTHPYSHVCFYYNGKEFGMNQGGDRSACDKDTDWSDALGALRMKGWCTMIESHRGHNEIKFDGPSTKGIDIFWEHANSSAGYTLYYVQAGPDSTSLAYINKIDSDQLLITAKGGNNYFQNEHNLTDPHGTHYGVEVDGRLSQYKQTREKNPNVIVFYEDTFGNCHVVTANEYALEPEEVNFAVTPYAVRIHRGEAAYYRSYEYGDRDDVATNQSFWMKIGSDWCIGVAINCVPRDVTAFGLECNADELIIMDSGGSAQLLGWNWEKNDRMNTYLKSDRQVSGTGVLATKVSSLINLTQTQHTTPTFSDTPINQPVNIKEDDHIQEIAYPVEQTQTTPQIPMPTLNIPKEEESSGAYVHDSLAEKLASRKMWAAIIPFIVGLAIKFGVKETLATELGSLMLMVIPPVIYMIVEAWVDMARAKQQDTTRIEQRLERFNEWFRRTYGDNS